MRSPSPLPSLALVLALSGCSHRVAKEVPVAPATVYVAERVRTLDPQRPLATALAVRSGRILAVGSREQVLEAAGGDAHLVELSGATLVPGLVDAHGHLQALGASLSTLSLEGARSLKEVYARLESAPGASYDGDWLVGQGWDQNDWAEGERAFPDRSQLDVLFPKTPVYLSRVDGHAVWVNGEALRRAGITRATRDPAGGRIVRDARGEPTGVLVDNATSLVDAKLPVSTPEQRRARLRAALTRCVELGLTSVHDAGMSLSTFTDLQQWDAVGRLPLRVYAMAEGQGSSAATYLERGTFQGRRLTMRAVKFLLDGALGSRGAALEKPYSDEPQQSGLLLIPPEELETQARAFASRGFQVAVHAIGDRANHVVIEVLSRLEQEHPDSRHRIEHTQVLAPEDLQRLAQAHLVASMQPTHATSDMPWAEARLGRERLRGAYAWRSLLDAGAVLAFGSDFPVEDPNPLLGLYAARTRQDAAGKPEGGWMPEQRLSGEEALRAFTTGAAWAAFAEEHRGLLREGMDADFVALTVDPVEGEARALLEARVLLTVVGGEVVFQREAPRPPAAP